MFVPRLASSARAQELARELEETVARFRQRYPDMSAFEVRQALRQASCTAGASAQARALVAIAAAIAVALGISLQFFQRHAPTPEAPAHPAANPWMLPAVAIAIVLVGVLALFMSRR